MLFPLFLSSTAEEDHYTSAQQADSPRDPTVPPNLTAPPHLRARAQVKDAATPAVGPDAELRPRLEGKVFAEARTAVWTETEAGAGGKVFAETGIVTEAHAWAEAGWRPVDAEEGVPGDLAPMLGQEQGGEEAFSSVLTALTETAELQAPTVRKPLGLLSKAAWTFSSSSKAGSSSTTKASSVASSSSSSSPSSHAAVTANVSVVLGNNNSSDNNSFGTY